MAIRFRQFRLLLWKNFILQIRRPIGTTFEILVPLALISILILPKKLMTTNAHCFSTFEPKSSLTFSRSLVYSDLVLAYYPPGKPVPSLMERVSQITGLRAVNKSVIYNDTFNNLNEVVAEVTEHQSTYLGVIVFDVAQGKDLPNKVKYTIRLPHNYGWNTDRTYPSFQEVGAKGYNAYMYQFLPLQIAIDMAIIQEKTGTPPKPFNIQQLPYPGYVEDPFASMILRRFLPLVLTLAFLYSAMSMIKEIVFEKQNRLKESMKMMGLANWVHWLAWYIKCLLFLMISVVLITAIIKGMKIFEFSNAFVVFLFFLLYAMSSISYCFFISVFFSNSKMSMLFGCVLWYAAFLPFQVLELKEEYDQLSRSAKAAMCLLPNSAVGVGATLFARLESLKVGVTFDNINQPTSSDDTFTMASVMGMMLVSSAMFMILAWYIEGIFPGKYGIPKPFYFPFQKSYWCGFSNGDVLTSNTHIESFGEYEKETHHGIEDEPTDLEVGVGIKDLRKAFKGSKGSKVAVDGLTLNMYKGQITALLGHNGAGKTTTMSILAGLFPPTSGTAHVGNKSILTDIDGIRESLGLCPQHNVLFDRLTVKEHLEFFINLKGKYGQAAKDEVIAMITDMQLLDKMNEKSTKLSGGMKRKLSCAIALVGGSETVFLDEPTSGMDPYARRATWDLLLKYKAGKTIILTTHFMDEADFLGDRIAIMADGQLRCCGSSLFLKSRYGVGYHLTLVKKENFDENLTINAIKRVVPSAEVLSNVAAELELVLNRDDANSFETLFFELETKKDDYGIASFGVSVTTMEEVFMKVGEGSEKTVEDIIIDHEHHEDTENLIMPDTEEPQMGELLKGFALKWQQYKAMFIKRFLNSIRDKKAVITQLLLPLVMVLMGLLLINSNLIDSNDPPRLLSLSNLSTGGSNTKAFYADFNQSNTNTFTVVKDYLKTVRVDAVDITDNAINIARGNANNSITVKGSSYKYSSSHNQSSPCCNYQFLVLNQKCKSDFLKKSLSVDTCSKYDKFGYKYCPECLIPSGHPPFYNGDCPMALDKTVLNNMNLYFTEYVLEKSNANDYFNKHVAGFTFAPLPKLIKPSNASHSSKPTIKKPPTTTTLWYSNQALHTIADAMNAMSNILLRQLTGNSNHGIEITNYPLPKPAANKQFVSSADILGGFFLALFLSMGMAFMAASFITFLVYERSSKAKHLQFVSGVDSVCYWLATYTWDYINYFIAAIFVLILIAGFQVDELKDDLGSVFLLLLLFGLCVLPFIYCLSFLFKSPLTAYIVTFFLISVLSLGMLIGILACRSPDVMSKKDSDIMHYMFLLFPTYALSISINDICTNNIYRKMCKNAKTTCRHHYTDKALDWDMPGVGQEALFMFVEAIVLFLVTLLLQKNITIRKAPKGSQDSNNRRSEDQDVYAERTRIANLTKEQIEEQAVVLKDLTKIYRGTNMAAVDHLSLGIPRGQCFGLLGVNGAGKTTTFSMLTGDLSITDGSAYLDGYNLQTQLRQVQQRIGYCPQFDALIERMTGREMLVMYARLRGVHPSKIDDIVSATIENMNLGKWADKLCGNYSGGNKRKLSTAIALVGDPPIVFLDEPSTGLDPVARRFLWDSLSRVLIGGRSIVLTSHSMEECDVLCTRLAIMVNGQFKCVGSPQHLKSRFGTGYTMMIKVKANNENAPQQLPLGVEPAAISRAKSFVEQTFQGAVLMESHSGMMTYQITNDSLTWSQIFGHLERNREVLNIVDYSVSQTTLEQVFINFAKEQHSEERTKVKRKCGCLPCC